MFTSYSRPDRDPFESLYASLQNRYNQAEAEIARAVKVDTLNQTIKTLKQPGTYWFILIDQFEELFTTSDPDKRNCFIRSLVHLSRELDRGQEHSVKIMATMRADFLDRFSPYPSLVRATSKHCPFIAEMQPDELRLAIEQPAALHGVIFEPGLVEEIIKEVQGQAGYLPLLQYTLNLLWESEVKSGSIYDRTLNIITYRELGGVRGALQKHVDEIYKALSEERQLIVERIFLKLVGIGEDRESGMDWKPVRRRAFQSDFSDPLEKKVLTQLIDQNLLVSDRSPESQGSTVEIAHEILLTSWTTLNTWIKHNRQAITLRNRLNDDVRRWQVGKKDTRELWDGSKLERVLELKKDSTFNQVLGGFSSLANEFINASVNKRDRQRHRTVFGLITFSAIAFLLAVFAGWQWHQSELRELELLSNSARSSLSVNQEWNALITSLKAARKLKRTFGVSPDTRRKVIAHLQQAVYRVREHNHLEGHRGRITDAQFSPDGQMIASASWDNTIKLWNLKGQELKTLSGHSDRINSISFSPDGQELASGSEDGTIKLWSLSDGQERQTLPWQSKIYSVSFSPDGQKLASGSEDGTIRLWNLTNAQELQTFKLDNSNCVKSVDFSPDGQMLASGHWDNCNEYQNGMVKLWNSQTGQELTTLSVVGGNTSVRFSADGQILATAGWNGVVEIYDPQTGQKLKTFGESLDWHWILSLSFSPDSQTIAAAYSDGSVKLWNLEGEVLHTFWHKPFLESAGFSPDGQFLVSGGRDNIVKLWKVQGWKLRTLSGHEDGASNISFSPDGQTIATASWDGTAKLWNRQDQELKTLQGHTDRVNSVSFTPESQTIGTASRDRTVKLWNIQGQELQTLQGHSGSVNSVSFSPDGQLLASASDDQTVKLWHLPDGRELYTLQGHTDQVFSVHFSTDGQTLASTSGDTTIKLWNSQTGQERQTLRGHTDQVFSTRFSPSGQLFASGSRDGTIKLWNLKGQELRNLTGLDGVITSVSFSPDGRLLASGIWNNHKVQLWSVEGEKLAALVGHTSPVLSVAFNPDDQTLASASADKTVILWNFDLDDLIVRGCEWLYDYLKNRPDSDPEKHLCDGIQPSGQLLVEEGRNLAQAGNLKRAGAKFQQALKLNPHLDLDPDIEAQRVRKLALSEAERTKALTLVKEGDDLVNQGKITEALSAYGEAQQLDPTMKIPANSWNALCWKGALVGYAAEVMDACNRAVASTSGDGNIRDNRGLARALTGNTQGAIEDFQAFIDWTNDDRLKAQRQRWVDALRAGSDPFTPEELESLRR